MLGFIEVAMWQSRKILLRCHTTNEMDRAVTMCRRRMVRDGWMWGADLHAFVSGELLTYIIKACSHYVVIS